VWSSDIFSIDCELLHFGGDDEPTVDKGEVDSSILSGSTIEALRIETSPIDRSPLLHCLRDRKLNLGKLRRHVTPCAAAGLFGKGAKDIDRPTHQIGARAYCREPFQIDVENFGAAVKLRETSIDSKPEGPIAARQGNGIGFVGQVLREHPIG